MEVFEILRPDAQHHRDDIDGKFGAIVEIEVGAPLCLEAFNQMVEARPDEAAPYVQAVPGEGGLDKRPELAMPRIVRPHQRRSEEHTAELQSLMRISYALFCLQKK